MLRLRFSNSGPEATPAGAGSLLGPFATYHRRAAAGATYDAGSIGAATAIQQNPVVPGTSALLSIPLPDVAAPDGYKWSLQAQFSGLPLQVCPSEGTNRMDIQQQYQNDVGAWVPLSPSGSGTYSHTLNSPEGGDQINDESTVALLALRDLDAFVLAADAETVELRVAWGIFTGTGGLSRFLVADEPIGDLEVGRNGWDWSVAWVLRPSTDID